MDNELDRSVRLLENALSTSGRGLFKRSFGIPSSTQTDESSELNCSLTLNPDEIRHLMTKKNKLRLYEDTMMNTFLDVDKTVMGSVLQADAPWSSMIESLHMEFFEVLQSHSGGHDVLEVVSELARCCSDALKVIRGLKSKVAVSHIEEEKWLEKERDTWRLLFVLYQDRLLSQNLMEDDNEILQYYRHSERLCMENLYKRDSLVRECQLIIDWLECQEAEKDDQVLHFSDSTVGWENTLHQLQSADTIAFGSSRQTVTQLDPDAPNYQKLPLHDLDAEDDKRLAKKIFQEIRCGKLDEAQKLCRQCGHSWKAAIFEGWRLFHNPNIKEDGGNDNQSQENDDGYVEMESNELQEIEGNSNRDLWKSTAIRFCKQDYLSLHEKASIASYCGYVGAMLPVCNSWEDSLWAYMKSMVDIRVESEIRDCVNRNEDYLPLPDEYWAQRISLNELFTHLDSSKNVTVREQSREPQRVIQKYIILDEPSLLFGELEEWTEDPNASTHFLRFAAHVALFLDQIGRGVRESVERILESYIKRLMTMHETQLVAYYVSKLSLQNQTPLYAQYLESIVDTEERKSALTNAEDSGLDVFAVTKLVVENIRSRPHDVESSGNLQHKITEMDKFKISSLDWVLFYDKQITEALVQSNALIFTFLAMGKVDAAQLAFNKIPANAVKRVLNEGSNELDIGQIIKEHLSYKAYLDAYESFNEWFKQSKNKPVPPEEVPENAQFPEKVAHQHRVSQYKAEIERWKLTTSHLAKTAKTMLYNVLLFPEGWLLGAKDADFLRSSCIPEVTFLLYSVLYESALHEECVQLADIIASEKYGIYKVYPKQKLGELLVKLCESSVALLNEQKDPWGNESSA